MSLKAHQFPGFPPKRCGLPRSLPQRESLSEAPRSLGTLIQDEDFVLSLPKRPPALPPWRWPCHTAPNFGKPSRIGKRREAVRARIDWKYLLMVGAHRCRS